MRYLQKLDTIKKTMSAEKITNIKFAQGILKKT